MKNRHWCPKCKKYQPCNKNNNCKKCKTTISYVYFYLDSNKVKNQILVDLYEKGELL